MKDSLSYLVNQLLINNNISLDKKELAFQIQSHPSYPSLHAVTGVLDHFNVDNLALDVPDTEDTLKQLPKVFLAQILHKNQSKEFAIVNNKGPYYQITTSKSKKQKLSASEFLDMFTGVMVAVEKTDLVEEKNNSAKVIKNSLIIVSSLIVLSLFFSAKPSLIYILIFISSILGLFISVALKKQEQGIQNIIGNAFCSGESEKKDCNAVLTSKGANIFNLYKLSDLCLIFFSGLSLSMLFTSTLNISASFTFALILLSVPITLYSIYYQAVILKKWCLLCMSVVAILWIQSALIVFNVDTITSASWSISVVLVNSLGFLLALTLWHLLANNLDEFQGLKKVKIDLFKFKRNFNIFNSLLQSSKTIDTTIYNASEIVFGNADSSLNIVIVTSPFCGHCKPVHSVIEDILKKHSDRVAISIRFNANTDYPENNLVKIASRLIEIYNTNGEAVCLRAMHSIYQGQQTDAWLDEFGNCNNIALFFEELKKEQEWCTNNNLNFTPVILINGKTYPKEYDRADLIYFIEALYEENTISTEELKLTT
ncbi:vitamin K epoxide reductase family protein [Pontimicrobium aquaticum]|uniref:Vitamin K epoxide reductase domain-containing protein n=1 Tax=Pontimicrobium aquaticum TaxID=2565367 RepID=A0A4U0F012_9FLAO|nr:vitamin K epoxide reductase family protein [Pontimicrobium aquaticum]TJY37697.1 hypothetical protein E5167_00130 [Pontimicrobium aquaticum]